jgi:Protein of unknown function (DUF4242)
VENVSVLSAMELGQHLPELRERAMPKFVIEREIAGAGKLPKQELQAISQKSCSVLQSMGPKIQWI